MDVTIPIKKLNNRKNVMTRLDKIESSLSRTRPSTRLNKIDELSNDLGDMYAGRFISPGKTALVLEPASTDFTGTFISGYGETFGGVIYNIGGVHDGVLQWGARQDDGVILAGGGDVVLDTNGISLYSSSAFTDESSIKWYNAFNTEMTTIRVSSYAADAFSAGEITTEFYSNIASTDYGLTRIRLQASYSSYIESNSFIEVGAEYSVDSYINLGAYRIASYGNFTHADGTFTHYALAYNSAHVINVAADITGITGTNAPIVFTGVFSGSASTTTEVLDFLQVIPEYAHTDTISNAKGIRVINRAYATGDITALIGMQSQTTSINNSGGIASATEFLSLAYTSSATSSIITNHYGFSAQNMGDATNSRVTNAYGFYASSQTGATNNYAIYTNEGYARFGDLVLLAADGTGVASTVGLSNVVSGVSTGTGTVKMNGATSRNSTGWWKIYDGTGARYVPFWTTITG